MTGHSPMRPRPRLRQSAAGSPVALRSKGAVSPRPGPDVTCVSVTAVSGRRNGLVVSSLPKPSAAHSCRTGAGTGPVMRSTSPRPARTAASTCARVPLLNIAQLRSSSTSRSRLARLAASRRGGASPMSRPLPAAMLVPMAIPASAPQRRRYLRSGPADPATTRTRGCAASTATTGTIAVSTIRRPESVTRRANSAGPAALAVVARVNSPVAVSSVPATTRPAGSNRSTRPPGTSWTLPPTRKLAPGATAGGRVSDTSPRGNAGETKLSGRPVAIWSRGGRPAPMIRSPVVPE